MPAEKKAHALVGEWIECFGVKKRGIGRMMLLKIRADGTYSHLVANFGPCPAPNEDQTEVEGGMTHGRIDLATWKLVLPDGKKPVPGFNEEIFRIKGDILTWEKQGGGGAGESLTYRRIAPDER